MMQRIQLVFERKKRGWSSTQAASFFDVSLASYSRIERGHSNGTMKFWRRVQEAFNIPDYLMWSIIWPADDRPYDKFRHVIEEFSERPDEKDSADGE